MRREKYGTKFKHFCRTYTEDRNLRNLGFENPSYVHEKLQKWIYKKRRPRYLFDCFVNSQFQLQKKHNEKVIRKIAIDSFESFRDNDKPEKRKSTSALILGSKRLLKKVVHTSTTIYNKSTVLNDLDYPRYINWIRKGVITLPLDQGKCGSCFIFSTLAAIDAMARMQNKTIPLLSSQELLDCTGLKNSCEQGYVSIILNYIKENGIEYNDNYPYQDRKYHCKVVNTPIIRTSETDIEDITEIPSRIDISEKKGYIDISNNTLLKHSKFIPSSPFKRFFGLRSFEQKTHNIFSLLKALKNGPLIAVHLFHKELRNHKNSIYFGIKCSQVINSAHYILIVGANIDAIFPYLWIKNSWGPDYNIHGFYRMAIGPITAENPGPCEIFKNDMFQPLLKNLSKFSGG